MFDFILSLAGYSDLASTYDKSEILNTAKTVRPGTLENVEDQRAKEGKTTRWSVLSSKLVINWVYGLDYIIDASPGQRFGFDVTTNPEKVRDKITKLRNFSSLWKAIGVTKAAVVLLVPPKDFGTGLLYEQEKEQLIDELLESVIYALDEQGVEVRSYVFTF